MIELVVSVDVLNEGALFLQRCSVLWFDANSVGEKLRYK